MLFDSDVSLGYFEVEYGVCVLIMFDVSFIVNYRWNDVQNIVKVVNVYTYDIEHFKMNSVVWFIELCNY